MDGQEITGVKQRNIFSKKHIVWGLAGLAMLTGIVVAIVLLTGPSKQDYKDAADGAIATLLSYGDRLSMANDRATLTVDAIAQGLIESGSREMILENRILDQDIEALESIEQEERRISKTIAQNERYIDETIGEMGDGQVQRTYAKYLEERKKIYGPGRDAVQFGESLIETERALYGCSAIVISVDRPVDAEEARAYLSYSKGCLATVDGAADSDNVAPSHREVLSIMGRVVKKRIDLLEGLLSSGDSSRDFYGQMDDLINSQSADLEKATNGEMILDDDDLRTALNELSGMVQRKKMNAPGSIEE